MAVEWIKVTPENKPDKEVLALNFAPGTYGYKERLIGYVYADSDNEVTGFACETEGVLLENVTHFIDLDSIPWPAE